VHLSIAHNGTTRHITVVKDKDVLTTATLETLKMLKRIL